MADALPVGRRFACIRMSCMHEARLPCLGADDSPAQASMCDNRLPGTVQAHAMRTLMTWRDDRAQQDRGGGRETATDTPGQWSRGFELIEMIFWRALWWAGVLVLARLAIVWRWWTAAGRGSSGRRVARVDPRRRHPAWRRGVGGGLAAGSIWWTWRCPRSAAGAPARRSRPYQGRGSGWRWAAPGCVARSGSCLVRSASCVAHPGWRCAAWWAWTRCARASRCPRLPGDPAGGATRRYGHKTAAGRPGACRPRRAVHARRAAPGHQSPLPQAAPGTPRATRWSTTMTASTGAS